ncbi:hypothetical protein [Haloarchaeobius amylolyticus]|uniref:hypothetical protein n=1 Tax=Haloarchaeobius amylolyticus TaxID=1198296 RepID=UPI00227204E5|nr:hypothetical protein [Haloarchaeobius amylolyticus]
MQRRAAAAYVALFLALTAGAYAFITIAEAPEVGLENPDATLTSGDTLTVDGRQYNATEVSASESSGGGHGGGGGVTYTAKLVWVNESATTSETWTNNTTVTYQNTTYRAFIANTSSPNEVTLRWEPGDQYSPQWVNGTQYIDGDLDQPDRQAVTVEEYIANNDSIGRQTLEITGDTYNFKGNQSTVTREPETLTFTWTQPKENEVSFGQNANVTLNGVEYAAHFPDGESVQLKRGEAAQKELMASLETEDRFHERINGLWGVVLVGGTALVLLVGLAFLPRKE